MLFLALFVYAFAMVLANSLVAKYGLAVVPYNAFFLIGLDLALRDYLGLRLRPQGMLALIAGAGVISLILNPAAAHIAAASALAFIAAGLCDWGVFSSMRDRSYLQRSNASNVVGALVDSLVFQALAFKGVNPEVLLQMVAAKVAGGAIWAWLLSRRVAA